MGIIFPITFLAAKFHADDVQFDDATVERCNETVIQKQSNDWSYNPSRMLRIRRYVCLMDCAERAIAG